MSAADDTREAFSLPWLGVIEARGPDAVPFLQGQLTNDTRLLADGRTQLAALNTAQGRVIALLRLKQVDESVYLLLPRDLVDTVIGRLKKYVLRAKVQLASSDRVALGLVGPLSVPDTSAPVFDYGAGRRIAMVAGSDPLVTGTSTDADRDQWIAEDIRLGLPQVSAATSEAFIPQMLNLDLLDGISFTKGCYTGQEIVVRTQHLGRIKRRALRYHVAEGPVPAPLQGLFLDGIKVGEVLMSAAGSTGAELLAVTNLEARNRPLALEDGRTLVPLTLPYSV